MIPLQVFVAAFLAWLNGEQRDVVPSLGEEDRVLKAQLGRRGHDCTTISGVVSRLWAIGFDAVSAQVRDPCDTWHHSSLAP